MVVRTLLKTFLLGAASIALIEAGLIVLLKAFGASATVSFGVLLLVTLASFFALGCILHLELERHKKDSYRPDMGEVVQLQQSQNLRVKPISDDSQREARGESRHDNDKGDDEASALDRTGIFVADRTLGALVAAPPLAEDTPGEETPVAKTIEEAEPNLNGSTPSEEESRNFSIPDALEAIHKQGAQITKLLKNYQPRVEEVEARMPRSLFPEREEAVGSLVDARRILAALDSRCRRLRGCLISQKPRELMKAQEMLRLPLIIPGDAVNSLVNSSELPSIPPAEWEGRLEAIVSSLEDDIRVLPVPRAQGNS